jgi:hypothetical protein
MECGVSASKIDDIGFITQAENLDYSFCWAADRSRTPSPMCGKGWSGPGRTLGHFYTAALVNLVMLEPHEAFNRTRHRGVRRCHYG